MTDTNGWRKSTYSSSNGGNCTEVAAAPGAILVRDSKDPGGTRLTFSPESWRAFAARIKAAA